MIINGVTSHSLITWLLATMGMYAFSDSEPQETRTQVPAAMGRQSEGSILNASKRCPDYARFGLSQSGALSLEIILFIGVGIDMDCNAPWVPQLSINQSVCYYPPDLEM